MRAALRAANIDPRAYEITVREGYDHQPDKLRFDETDLTTGVVVGMVAGGLGGALMIVLIAVFTGLLGWGWPLAVAMVMGAVAGAAAGALGGGLGGLTVPARSLQKLGRTVGRDRAPLQVTIHVDSGELLEEVERILAQYDTAHVEKSVVLSEDIHDDEHEREALRRSGGAMPPASPGTRTEQTGPEAPPPAR